MLAAKIHKSRGYLSQKFTTLREFARTHVGNRVRTYRDYAKRMLLRKGRLSITDQIHLVKRLSFLVRSGIPILQALFVLSDQAKSRKQKMILEASIHDVSNGEFLHASLSRSGSFDDVVLSMMAVGETSGTLDQNLHYIAEELDKRRSLKRKIVGALIYPMCISVATIGMTILLTSVVFPKVMPVFASLHVKLPLATRVLLFVSNFLTVWGIYSVLLAVVLGLAAVIFYKKSARLRRSLFTLLLNLSVIGSLGRDYHMARLCRMTGLLLESGLTLSNVIEITAKATSNELYRREYIMMHSCIIEGSRMSDYLETEGTFFPEMLTQMIAIGEMSGTLSQTLLHLSKHFEEELDTSVQNLSRSIEPILMVSVGLMVGFVAISILSPVYEITQHVKH